MNVIHAQMRMSCSKLNAHLFLLHVKDSPSCNCGLDVEDNNHFLLYCPLYVNIRQRLFHAIINFTEISEEVLLYGNSMLSCKENTRLFLAVHCYIKDSNRFT